MSTSPDTTRRRNSGCCTSLFLTSRLYASYSDQEERAQHLLASARRHPVRCTRGVRVYSLRSRFHRAAHARCSFASLRSSLAIASEGPRQSDRGPGRRCPLWAGAAGDAPACMPESSAWTLNEYEKGAAPGVGRRMRRPAEGDATAPPASGTDRGNGFGRSGVEPTKAPTPGMTSPGSKPIHCVELGRGQVVRRHAAGQSWPPAWRRACCGIRLLCGLDL